MTDEAQRGPASGERPAAGPNADRLVRTISTAGGVSIRALIATDLVRLATAGHRMAPTARSTLSRTLMGAVLLAAQGKHGETVQIELRGDGPIGRVMATADEAGRARGVVSNPAADPRGEGGRLDIAAAIGSGLLSVSRRRPGWPEPHTGMVVLETGEVARDLAIYLTESEQVPSAVGLSVALSPEGQIEGAGGFLVQALADARDDELRRIEANVQDLGATAERVRAGMGADGLLDLLTEGVGVRNRHYSTPTFYCPCSRSRALRTLKLLGSEEIVEIIEGGEGQEVLCEFCGERYAIRSDELRSLLPLH